MNDLPDAQAPHDADTLDALRARMRADLRSAIKARQPEATAALRTALAAIDNAGAIAVPASDRGRADGVIAGATSGVGSTEAARRDLSIDDLRALLQDEVATRIAAADQYDRHGQSEAAGRLRQEAAVLRRYLPG